MSREPAEAPSNFPHWVTLGSLAFVLWLFFTNTVPATQERAELQNLDAELTELRIRYDQAIEDARLRIAAEPDYDLQALLLAIDAQGFTPAELCLAFPEARVLGPRAPSASGTPR
ncbi:MAG: hypothetical protein JNL12_19810 [Planctomycetes bacterium]|nr:hypothetical protein [Planctomycetota bacterium]